mmetsp:Transcript_21843/g.60835  ORF Transcript_21843/g.60835 Transcript_21843/m.60835 type:complete len:81 (-) Transcript_21843:1710-1952(-)
MELRSHESETQKIRRPHSSDQDATAERNEKANIEIRARTLMEQNKAKHNKSSEVCLIIPYTTQLAHTLIIHSRYHQPRFQ